MGFKNCLADHDVWLKADEDEYGNKYYTYICIYVDDIMIISHNTDKYMNMIKNVFLVKPESIGTPRMYLGMNCKKTNDRNWVIGSSHYLEEFLKLANCIVEYLDMKVNRRGNYFLAFAVKTRIGFFRFL